MTGSSPGVAEHISEYTLDALVLEEGLSTGAMSRAAEHVGACDHCRHRLQVARQEFAGFDAARGLAAAQKRLAATDLLPPADLPGLDEDAGGSMADGKQGGPGRVFPMRGRVWKALAVAATLAVIAGGTVLLRQYGGDNMGPRHLRLSGGGTVKGGGTVTSPGQRTVSLSAAVTSTASAQDLRVAGPGHACTSDQKLHFLYSLRRPGYAYLFAYPEGGRAVLLHPARGAAAVRSPAVSRTSLMAGGRNLALPLRGVKGRLFVLLVRQDKPLAQEELRRALTGSGWLVVRGTRGQPRLMVPPALKFRPTDLAQIHVTVK